MADTEHQIGFEQLGLGGVLKGHRVAVDTYQREYAWEKKEVTTLFSDFSKEINDGSTFYFLGTIVTIPKSNTLLEVVDGQQRLATTAILLSSIRKYLMTIESERELAQSIEEDFLSVFDRPSRSRVARLQLNIDDNEFFRSRLAGESEPSPTRHSHHLIEAAFIEAANHVRNVVSEYKINEHGTVLNRWIDFIETKASVILLRVPNADNAYRMFETLNDRGKRVSQSDLVKSYLYGQAGTRRAEVQQKWAFMRGALESMEDEESTIEYLKHAVTIIRGFVRGSEVYEAVRTLTRGEQPAVSFSSQLETLANAYVAISVPEHDRWNEVTEPTRRALEVINLFDLKIMRPVLLAISHRFDVKELAKTMPFCVSVSVRLMISNRTRVGNVEEGLADAGHRIYRGDITNYGGLKAFLAGISVTDGQFKAAFQNATVSKAVLSRYYLRSLEMKAKDLPDPWHIPTFDKSIINLEHVLPDKPEDQWPQFSDDEVKIYRNRIGNLVLIKAEDNSKLRSQEFAIKRRVYSTSPYELTKQVAQADTWDVSAIEDRQSILSDLAVKTWPL